MRCQLFWLQFVCEIIAKPIQKLKEVPRFNFNRKSPAHERFHQGDFLRKLQTCFRKFAGCSDVVRNNRSQTLLHQQMAFEYNNGKIVRKVPKMLAKQILAVPSSRI